jgi:integrase
MKTRLNIRLWRRPGRQPGSMYYYAVWEDSGRTRQKSLKTQDERQANLRLKAFERDLVSGRVDRIQPSALTMSLAEFRIAYLEHAEKNYSIATYKLLCQALDKALDCFGRRFKLHQMSDRHLDLYKDHLIATGLAPATVNKNLRHFKMAIKKAMRWKYISKDLYFPKPLKETEDIRFLSKLEVKAIVEAIDHDEFRDIVIFAVNSGLRSGEIVRLTKYDVDNPPGELRVSSAQKNREEWRIPINLQMRNVLDRHNDKISVFSINSIDYVSHMFKTYARKAGLPDARFHDLRHTFAVHHVLAGTHIKKLQLLMRHKSLSSTTRYMRFASDQLRDVCNNVDYGLV